MATLGAIGGAAARLSIQVGVDGADKAAGDLRRLEGDTNRAGSGLGGTLARGAGLAGAALLTAGAAAGGFGLKIAAGNEQAQISFTTMLGSAEKAGAFLKELKAFAASTPFEFPELQTAASSLISAGFEASKVIPIMTTLGDVTSGMGTGAEGVKRATVALQQMSAAGRITGEDLNQLRDAGIPVFDLLAGATGKSKAEIAALAQAGKLGATEMNALFAALETGGGGLERFSGLMEKQSQSLTGLISTLKDTVGQGLADIMGPAVEGLKAAMPGFTTAIASMMEQAGPGLTGIVSTILDLFSTIMPTLGPILGALGETFRETFANLAPAIKQILPALSRILIALLPVLPALANALVAIAPAATVVANAFASIIEAIPPNLLAALVVGFITLGPPLVTLFSAMAAGMPILAALSAMFPVLAAVIGFLISPIGLIVLAIAALAAIAIVVVRNWSTIAGFFSGLWSAVLGVVSGAVGAVVGFVMGLYTKVQGILRGLPGVVIGLFSSAWNGARTAVSTAIGTLVGVVAGVPGRILGALGDLGGLLLSAGKAVVQGLINGIKAMFGALAGVVKSLASKITGPVGRFLGISSPSRVMMRMGRLTGEGLAIGLAQSEATIARAAARMAGAALVGPQAAGAIAGASGRLAGISAGLGARVGGASVYAPVTVHGSVITEHELAAVIAKHRADTEARVLGPSWRRG